MKKRIFLIHGWEGRPDNHWFPWLSWELKARGFEVHALAMPHPDKPKAAEWVAALKDAVDRPDENTYFVGHSLGCIATLRYLEALPKSALIGGCVFVAGFSGDLNIPEIQEFYAPPPTEEFFESAKKHCQKFVTIFSDNDEYVSLERALEFQKALGAKAILERGKGYFSKGDGVTALPSAFQALMAMSGTQ